MFKRTKVSVATSLLVSGLAITALPVFAQAPPQASPQATQRVEITGSSIKRTNAEGPAPVDIYTRRDIERTGATTISELVKNIAAIDVNDQGELTSNSPSGSGASNLQVRGLSERNLLVLLNGRRLPTNALTDGTGAGSAVDVNNIPISAIDRIEILKDGGSAIYGSDAVAGVINFITRKNYDGVEVRAGYGRSSRGDAQEKTAGVVAGFGDYDKSGFNVLGAFDIFRRDPIARKDRDLTRSLDWRRIDGVTDGRSGFHPNGNIIDPDTGVVLGQVVPCPPEDLKGLTCRFDFNKSLLNSTNGADRWSSMLIGNLKLGEMRASAEVVYAESKDFLQSHPAPGNFTDALGRSVNGRFLQVGPRTTNRKSTLLSTTLALEGSVGNFDWDVALGQGISKVVNNDNNFLNDTLFSAAIAAGLIDPTNSNNAASEIDKVRLTPKRDGKSVVRFLNAKTSGALMELPGGSLAFAVGATMNKESLRDTPDIDSQNGNVFGSIAQAQVDASRDLKAVFGELQIPILKSLEAQVAVRHDRYSGASGTIAGARVDGAGASRTSPKFAVKFRPADVFMMRASYAESFLAPSLKQLFGGVDEGAESTSDTDILCPAFGIPAAACDNIAYNNRTGSNPTLKPETGKTYNLGFVIEPTPTLSLGVDFWQIKKDNEVNQPTVETAVQAGNFARINNEWVVFTNNQNLSLTKSKGVDIDLRWRLGQTPFGKVTLRTSATYYNSIKKQDDPLAPIDEFVGTFLNPRWRNTFTANFDTAEWSTTLAVRTTTHMLDTDQPGGSVIASKARTIAAHEELDVSTQYSGIKNLTLAGSIKNLLDRAPPFSQRGASNQFGSLGFPWLYSPRGRFFQVSANYTFQ